MKHIWALITKYVINAVILEIILMTMTTLSFGSILWIALGVTLITYAVGDLLVLPRLNNTMTVVVDILMAFGALWLFDAFVYGNIDFIDKVIASFAVGIGEVLFHKFMGRSLMRTRSR